MEWVVTFSKMVHGPWKFDFLYIFAQLAIYQYAIFNRKTPNFAQIGCFLQ